MKKWLLISFIFLLCGLLAACGVDEEVQSEEQVDNNVFTETDIEKAEQMIAFLDDKINEFELKANEAIQNGDIENGDNDLLVDNVQRLGQEIVIKPFLEKFPGSMIPRAEDKLIPIVINVSSSQSCPLGNCIYDEVKVPKVDYSFNDYQKYSSKNFKATQLVFENIKTISESNDGKQGDTSEMSFVKAKDGSLIITSIPSVNVETLYLEKYDEELESIKEDVPESEVESAQAEYKESVEETLAKFPELQ